MVISNKTAVLLITEDPMVEIAVRHLLAAEHLGFDIRVCLSFKTLSQGSSWTGIDTVLADIGAGQYSERLGEVRRKIPGAALLCWSNTESFTSADLRGRCDGVISRFASSTELIDALLQVSPSKLVSRAARVSEEISVHLTYREGQLLALLGRGLTNKEIAVCLGITVGTVKVYLSTLFKKTGAKDRFELTLLGIKNSLFGVAELSAPIPVPVAARRAISNPLLKSMRLVQPRLDARAETAGVR